MRIIRNYSIIDYPKNEKKIFKFLIKKYNFKKNENQKTVFSFINVYIRDEIKIYLHYDKYENLFNFRIIKGKNTPDHSDIDDENIKMFWDLFMYFEPDFDYMRTQPDKNQYLDSLKLNAELLQKYGDKLLKGEEWYW